MARHLWTVCGQNVIIDALTNNVSVVNLVEQLNVASGAINSGVRLFLVSLWEHETAGAERISLKVAWVDPSGTEHDVTQEAVLEIPADKERGRWVCEVRSLPLPARGSYCLTTKRLTGEGVWETAGSWPVLVSDAS